MQNKLLSETGRHVIIPSSENDNLSRRLSNLEDRLGRIFGAMDETRHKVSTHINLMTKQQELESYLSHVTIFLDRIKNNMQAIETNENLREELIDQVNRAEHLADTEIREMRELAERNFSKILFINKLSREGKRSY